MAKCETWKNEYHKASEHGVTELKMIHSRRRITPSLRRGGSVQCSLTSWACRSLRRRLWAAATLKDGPITDQPVKNLFFDVRSITSRLIVSRTLHLLRVLGIGVLSLSLDSASVIGSVPAVPLRLRSTIPEISTCRQLILVTTASWDEVSAMVHLYKRGVLGKAPWRKVGQPFAAVVGQRGLGWGIGLHGTGEAGAPQKREGDRKAPAGVFRLPTVFGIASPAHVSFLRLPYQQLTATTVAVDDPGSKYYNQIVDRSAIGYADWSRAESILRDGDSYRFGVMIEHNRQPFPGYGSCIFLHFWSRNHSGTAGCTAVDLADLRRLLRWLDSKKNPLIVQLPMPEYLRLKQNWGLP